jgi:hypothetical protein
MTTQEGKIVNIEYLSQELQRYEQRRSALVSQMDRLYSELQAAMPTAAASWMNEEVERQIKGNPEVVQTLGIEKLRGLKSKLKALTKNLPEIVATEFQKSGMWPHHKVMPSFTPSEPHLNRVFRNVISHLGNLLNEFGLIEERQGSLASWEHTRQKRFRYAGNLGLHGLPEAKIEQYGILLDEYTSLDREIDDIQRSLDATKAKELWDKA